MLTAERHDRARAHL